MGRNINMTFLSVTDRPGPTQNPVACCSFTPIVTSKACGGVEVHQSPSTTTCAPIEIFHQRYEKLAGTFLYSLSLRLSLSHFVITLPLRRPTSSP
jgi:hypothetical protein